MSDNWTRGEATITPEKVKILVEGLVDIASFLEGPSVNSGFNEPVSAQCARDTLLKAGIDLFPPY